AEHIRADALHILRRDVAAAGNERPRTCGEGEGDGRTRAGAVADEAIELELVGRRLPRGEDDIDDVVLHPAVDVDVIHDLARADDVRRLSDREHLQVWRTRGHEVENLALLRLTRVADLELEHETVELRLGELIRAFLLQRILGSED